MSFRRSGSVNADAAQQPAEDSTPASLPIEPLTSAGPQQAATSDTDVVEQVYQLVADPVPATTVAQHSDVPSSAGKQDPVADCAAPSDAAPAPAADPDEQPSFRGLFPGLSVITSFELPEMVEAAFGRGGPDPTPRHFNGGTTPSGAMSIKFNRSFSGEAQPGFQSLLRQTIEESPSNRDDSHFSTAESKPQHDALLPSAEMTHGLDDSRVRRSTAVMSVDEYTGQTPQPSPFLAAVRRSEQGMPGLSLAGDATPGSIGNSSGGPLISKAVQSLRFEVAPRKDSISTQNGSTGAGSANGNGGLFPGYGAGVNTSRRARAMTVDMALDGQQVFRSPTTAKFTSTRLDESIAEPPLPSLFGRFCCCTINVRRNCFRVLSSQGYAVLATLATIYVLFADDIRLAAFPPSADDVFSGITCATLALFCAELLMCIAVVPVRACAVSLCRSIVWRMLCAFYMTCVCSMLQGYLTGLYVWLDIACILSLLPDIVWFWTAVSGQGDSRASGFYSDRNGSQFRAARAGMLRDGLALFWASTMALFTRALSLLRYVQHDCGREPREWFASCVCFECSG